MDFYSNPKRTQNFRIVLLIAFIILIILNIFNFLVNKEINYWGICANTLMAFSMVVEIRKYNKEKNSKNFQHK
jgi:antibiotic biosynthesis monooxygenase (ABM) superfamily enzyme